MNLIQLLEASATKVKESDDKTFLKGVQIDIFERAMGDIVKIIKRDCGPYLKAAGSALISDPLLRGINYQPKWVENSI